MKRNFGYLAAIGLLIFSACDRNDHEFDASGTFEADETIISSQAAGTLMSFAVDEGEKLAINQYLGFVDTTQLDLSRKQLQAQIEAVLSRKPDVSAQLAALQEQLKAALVEKQRVTNLLEADAATPKQLDDVNAQIDITRGNITALRSTLTNSTESIDREVGPLFAQIDQVNDQIAKSRIINPLGGTVLTTYASVHEQVGRGQPLYKIADIRELTLRAYITGDQLPKVQLNQQVTVLTDDGDGGLRETTGTIYWISAKAEFTPKTIQTKDERANKVYAIKIRVKNDGAYKIGMYGEVLL